MKNILSIIILLAFCFAGGYPLHAEMVTGSGCSVSNVGYLAELAKEYERRSGTKLFVKGGGSLIGIDDLRTGKVDFAASCRGRITDDPEGIKFIHVAWDALVFIVHKDNPVENISQGQIREVYRGQIMNWNQIQGGNGVITVFMSKSHKGLSGVESSLIELALQGKEPAVTNNTVLLASTGIVEQMVEKTKGGFAASGFSSARKRDVKMLKVNGVEPNKGNIIAMKYPFRRPLYILLSENPKQETKKFIDYVLSAEGQKFISSLGAISLLDIK